MCLSVVEVEVINFSGFNQLVNHDSCFLSNIFDFTESPNPHVVPNDGTNA